MTCVSLGFSKLRRWLACLPALGLLFFSAAFCHADALSPTAVVADASGKTLYVAASTASRLLIVDPKAGSVTATITLPLNPSGLVVSADGKYLYVTGDAPNGQLFVIDLTTRQVLHSIPAGHTPMSPVLGPRGDILFLCERFTNKVTVIDLAQRQVAPEIPVKREPVACGLTPDGALLFVANHLPAGTADQDVISAEVEVIDTSARKVVTSIPLPNGSSSLRGLDVSPDGRYVYVTHLLSRYTMPPTQLERGWMNTNAVSIIDVAARTLLTTVLLDDLARGAANPWAVACTADGRLLCLTHAGTHEVSIIDRLGLHRKIDQIIRHEYAADPGLSVEKIPNTLAFLGTLRTRRALGIHGPRGLAIAGSTLHVTGYFSDNLETIDLASPTITGGRITTLGPTATPNTIRRGELLFNDAGLCLQQWQSCASCHPDARADGLNWDLTNDGLGNPKNTRSLLASHRTPPVMSLAVRETAEMAVRSGLRFIQFAHCSEDDARAIDEYLKSLAPVASPYRHQGEWSDAAKRGEKLFADTGCAACHSGPQSTDLKSYDVGTGTSADQDKLLDTPTLLECWRTAPYLHDGRAATLFDVLKTCNPNNRHGRTTNLTDQQLWDLEEYILSQ
ncbi:MAG: c-type cytochrome [Phycisphaerae bacterium]|nr:c-type cytochrome [Phycisphaerae bacterium]